MNVLVTGATGYIGGRLVEILLNSGLKVSVLVRNKSHIEGYSWASKLTEVIEGDVLNSDASWVQKVYDGRFEVAYYLIHSIFSGSNFDELDSRAALNFCKAAQTIRHVIYLGGILPKNCEPSKHLASRAKTGEILRQNLRVTEFRAGTIIGSGSASFEMIRYLTERLPVMITPKWVSNLIQPIGIDDVLQYLFQAVDKDALGVVDIGAPALTFKEMMLGYAKLRGLKRFIISVPVLTPTLAGRWVGLVTPIPNRLAIPLIEGIKFPVVANTSQARRLFPLIEPASYLEIVKTALDETEKNLIETRWSNARGPFEDYTIKDWEGLIQERQTRISKASPELIFQAICSLGGETGWGISTWAWCLRGLVDRIIGGPGLAQGKRRGQFLRAGDSFDFFRIEKILPDRELLLRAEMKIPGRAWLRFEVQKVPEGTLVIQTAYFQPRGLWGLVYWYIFYLPHYFIFKFLLKEICFRVVRVSLFI